MGSATLEQGSGGTAGTGPDLSLIGLKDGSDPNLLPLSLIFWHSALTSLSEQIAIRRDSLLPALTVQAEMAVKGAAVAHRSLRSSG